MTAKTLLTAIALGALLTACTSAREQAMTRQARAAERTLERLPTIGDPGRVAAADIAFARMARDEGQWTAFRAYAASGAVVHGPGGPVPLETFINGRANPEQAIAWTPADIWSSCDGTLAVTFGRLQMPSGDVGSYVTVWELQSDRSYKWIYDIGALDNPQPAPEVDPDLPENAIIVPGMLAINGRIADCPAEGASVPQSPINITSGAPPEIGEWVADDGTLKVEWRQYAGGTRNVIVEWYRGGEWQIADTFTVPAGN